MFSEHTSVPVCLASQAFVDNWYVYHNVCFDLHGPHVVWYNQQHISANQQPGYMFRWYDVGQSEASISYRPSFRPLALAG